MHPFAALAKKAVTEFITNRKRPTPPDDLPPEFRKQAGVFVCLKKHGELRGCIGTFAPTAATLYQEIVKNAIAAASQDPRFPCMRPGELEEVNYSVDVLSEPEKVADSSELDPKRFGVIVSKGCLRGLLLPDLEGVDTVEEQLRITKMKAGISPFEDDVEIYRFTVERYS